MRRIPLLILSILVLAMGMASPAKALSLKELLPDLLGDHERLQAAVARMNSSFFDYREAKAGWYPTLDLTGDVAWEEIDYPGRDRAADREIRNIQRFRATQLLFDFGGTDSNISQNLALFERARADKELTRQTLIREAVRAYLDCMRFLKQRKFAMQSEESIVRQTGIEESLVERGAGLSSDVLQAKSSLAASKARRVVIEGQLENAKSRFFALFGFHVDDALIRDFEDPAVPYESIPMTIEEAVSVAMQENRQLALVDKDIEVAEAQIKNVKSRFYPTINLFGEYWRKENDGGEMYVEFEQRLGAEFAYNIYNGGGDVAALKSAEFSHRDAVNTLGDVQRTIEQNVRITWQNLLTAQAKASWFSNQANIEQEFLELARKERKLGNRSLLDVLNAEVNYINAVIGAIGAETDKAVAAYDLMFTMGRLELDLFMQ